MENARKYLGLTTELAREAGEVILSLAGENERPRYKEDGSPVTRADEVAHRMIAARLRESTPWPVVSEESRSLENQLELSADKSCYWLVDPLDGTHGFLRNDGEYTVNIALVEEGRPVLGVVYQPARKKLYRAASCCGSWLLQDGAAPVRMDTTARQGEKDTERVAVLSRARLSERMRGFLDSNGIDRRIHCSSSVKLCLVAEGEAQVYPRFGDTALWDTGAAAVVAREAGCRVVDLDGKDLRYDCTAGLLHEGFMVYDPNRIIPVL